MADISNLLDRIDKEFTALEDKLKTGLKEKVEAGKERQQRLEIFNKTLDDLKEIWGPRLDALVKRFGKKVEVTPRFIPATREATFEFQSKLARIRLKLSVSADRDIRNMVLAYDLEIVPSFMEYERHSETTFPVTTVDRNALAKWVEDRIVGFVRTYLSLHENDYYLKDHMVEDPVNHVRFPKFAAACTLEQKGQTLYFVSEENRREFEGQNK